MKVRMGFVSNSSSSSFLCELCGQIETDYDYSAIDFDMEVCVQGHTWHVNCMNSDLPEFAANREDAEFSRDGIPEEKCPFCQLQILSAEQKLKVLLNHTGLSAADIQKMAKEKYGTDKALWSDSGTVKKGELG